ncbi:putative disease resistance protein [Cinnamomum micranthum f. kanehirae]|uniref:Putative disease resistance protein n=1 Tax=Cinnamomum micranthum f. kanehirae TaxID=337451 RepID=A0A3S3P5Z0_9MAGN|nr:putative disease resistance protein [Cinnamomum micranthum f. kanehirae]
MRCSCAPIFRRLGYIKDLERNFERLNEKARALYDKKEDIQREIRRNGREKTPTSQCQSWISKVDEIQNQVNAIEEEYSKGEKRCLRRWCLDIPSSWKLGRRIVEKTNCILNLIEESNFEGGVVVDALPQIVETMPAITIKDGTSTKRTLQKILECMRNERTQKIGIWGMGGVGKTTVMKNLNNLPEIARMFEIVIWVTVAKDFSIRQLQTEIALRLSLKLLDEESNERVARRIFQSLRGMKFLLLMDDVWDIVDLEDIGIPYPTQGNGCKLVLTTRYRNVCHKMETNKEIMVELLSVEEAWELFREKAGEVVDSPNIQPLARCVVDECDGLPLAIVVIGASLRKEDNILIWENAVQELSAPATSDIYDMEERVFKRLKFSFDKLEDDNLKNCFLYAALFPEDHNIDHFELILYWRAEGLINSGSSLIDARKKGHAILKHLIDASLLLKSNGMIQMHDVIRDLALRITSSKGSGHRFLVRANKDIKDPPEAEEWKNIERMSLMQNKIGNLPESPNCPTLLTLFLQGNKKLRMIPALFFEKMCALRVLNLSETSVNSLPHSICYLVNLRIFYLKSCPKLRAIPPQIGAITGLEVLDAQDTRITSLPLEIEQLTHLKVLNVAFSMGRDEIEEDVAISGGIISRLSQLEQLRIDLRSTESQFEHEWNKWAEAILKDVSYVKGLMSLEFYFPQLESLDCFLQRIRPWKEGRFTSFNFDVGRYPSLSSLTARFGYIPELGTKDGILTIRGCDCISSAILEVLSHASRFKLHGHRSIHCLCELGMQNTRQLTSCIISECDAMEIFIEGDQLIEAALPNLKMLDIYDMLNLKSIWEGSFRPGSFNCLSNLFLSSCNKLKNIFSCKIITQLSNLQYLHVQSCSALEEVIYEEAIGVKSDCVLPKLRDLRLKSLPALVGILKGHLLNCSSLEEIQAVECPNLKRLPISISNAPKLREIHCKREWWNELEWDDNAIKLQLEPLLI